jgi:hypothetical protein
LKEFKILRFIPHTLRSDADVVVQLCCALVNPESIEDLRFIWISKFQFAEPTTVK